MAVTYPSKQHLGSLIVFCLPGEDLVFPIRGVCSVVPGDPSLRRQLRWLQFRMTDRRERMTDSRERLRNQETQWIHKIFQCSICSFSLKFTQAENYRKTNLELWTMNSYITPSNAKSLRRKKPRAVSSEPRVCFSNHLWVDNNPFVLLKPTSNL